MLATLKPAAVRWVGLISLTCLAALFSLTAVDAPPRSKLTIELVDAASMKSLSGLVRLETAAGAPVELEGLLSRGLGLDPSSPISKWSVVVETATVSADH